MKLRLISFFIITLGLLSASAANKLTLKDFAPKSRLAEGSWVKIGVDQTGVYEISHEALREMGFSNPEKVSIFGRGGVQCNTNFLSASGNILYYDDLSEVPAVHKNGKMYFYGVGTSELQLYISSKYDGGGYFSRKSKNIYSDMGFYFLTDSDQPKSMSIQTASNLSGAIDTKAGLGYYYCEEDLMHNNSDSGQLFYGELLQPGDSKRNWNIFLPNALEGVEGALECYTYFERGLKGNYIYGFEGAEDSVNVALEDQPSATFKAAKPTSAVMSVPGEKANIFVGYIPADDNCPDIANCDYWVLSYQKTIPNLIGENGTRLPQDHIAFPKIKYGNSGKIRIPGGSEFMAFEVSDPQNPVNLLISPDGADGIAKFSYRTTAPRLCIFDPLRPQLQIKGYEKKFDKVANQNLHEAAAQGAEFVIICTPDLRESAEAIANLHREKEGMSVLVATTEECYNEFSGGVPDPMAYRGLVRMVYTSPIPCKNLLLVGPLYADFRGIVNEKNPREGIIAYQANPMNMERGAANANDFLGIMTEFIDDTKLETQTVSVGVGILPLRSNAEGRTVADKIARFLDTDDFAYFLNMTTNIGGVGDNHTHDNQALEIGRVVNTFENNSTILTPVIIDAYGYKPAQDRFFSSLNSGTLFANYFGHGAAMTLNHEGDFFRASDVARMRNSHLPLITFAGCDISNPDRGVRGLGEMLVTSTPYGAIATMLATRQTWSGQNMDFFRTFYTRMYCNGPALKNGLLEKPLSLGEVFALAKTQSTYSNELNYQIIGDPALVFPVVTRPVVVDQTLDSASEYIKGEAGEYLEISGFVPLHEDAESIDALYNGTIVARLMQPFENILSADICTADDPETKHNLTITYANQQYSLASADVKDGLFSLKILVPTDAVNYADRLVRLHLTTYSSESKVAAGVMVPVQLTVGSGENTTAKDTEAPLIDLFEYSREDNALQVKVSDDVALDLSDNMFHPAFTMSIDGKEFTAASTRRPVMTPDEIGYSKTIALYDLSEGIHTAKVSVRDAAGNVATSEISFEYGPTSGHFEIALEDGVVEDSGRFMAVGESPVSADIIILDAAGFIVRRDNFTPEGYLWDACDNNGVRVAKGLYKAYIIETGSHTSKSHSATITVPVV